MNRDIISGSQVYGFLPIEIDGVDALAALALDMRWSWNHEADKLWQRLDPSLWELTHNPWIVLQTVAHDQLERQLADPEFRLMLDGLIKTKQTRLSSPAWFQENHADALSPVWLISVWNLC